MKLNKKALFVSTLLLKRRLFNILGTAKDITLKLLGRVVGDGELSEKRLFASKVVRRVSPRS